MKIVEVVPYFYPAWSYGGPAKLVYDVSKFLSGLGHEVEVLTSDCYDATRRMPRKLRLRSKRKFQVRYFANVSNHLASKSNIYFAPRLFLRAIPAVITCDVVHLHDFYTLHNIWISMLCRLFSRPYLISVHGCLETKRRTEKSFFKSVYLSLFGIGMLRAAAKVIATSDNETKSYLELGVAREKIIHMAHGVNPKEFHSRKTKLSIRAKLNIPRKALVFTFLGRIHRIKGIDLLLKAIAKINEPNLFFILAGSDNGYAKTVDRLIKQYKLRRSILRLGAVYGSQKADLFKASDAFIYPSRSEGFSLGILEAAAAGLPLLITSTCHFPEVKIFQAGFIMKPSVNDICEQIIQFSKLTPEARKTMSQNAIRLIRQRYSMSRVGRDLELLYEKH